MGQKQYHSNIHSLRIFITSIVNFDNLTKVKMFNYNIKITPAQLCIREALHQNFVSPITERSVDFFIRKSLNETALMTKTIDVDMSKDKVLYKSFSKIK